MADTWYVQDGDSEAIGPVTTELLNDGIRAGRVLPSARLCRVGGTDWTPLATHPLFSKVIREVAPPPPVAASSRSPAGAAPATTAQPLPPRPPMTGVRTSASRTLVIAGAAAVLLLVGVVGLRRHLAAVRADEEQQRRRADPLYIACIDKLPSELAGVKKQEFSCSGGTLSVTSFGNYTGLFFHDGRPGVPAGKVRSYVKAVLPNLAEPTRSAAYPCRHVMALNLAGDATPDGQLATAVLTYKMAEGVVETLERSGGHRYATWKVGAGGVVVENGYVGDASDTIILRVYPGPLPDAPGELRNVAWTDEPTCVRADTPELLSLRTKMMADGWWFDDAAAFMVAAKAVARTDDATLATQSYVISKLIRHSKNWDEAQREIEGRHCIEPSLKTASSGVAAPFDSLSGVDDKTFSLLLPPPAPYGLGALFVDEAGMLRERGRFDTSIGSPAHVKCVLNRLPTIDPFGGCSNCFSVFAFDDIWRTERLTNESWAAVWALASNARYAKVLYATLARSRADLVDASGHLPSVADAGPASTTGPSPSASSPTPKAAAGGSLTTSVPTATPTTVPTATPTTTATATTTAAPDFDPY